MNQTATPWLRVAEVAAAQYGVVSFAQLRAVGLGRGAVEKAVRGERLIRLHIGVYAVGHGVLRVEGSRLAAVLACGGGAVLSHRSAAAHWGLLPTARTLVDVTTPRTRRRVPGIDLHRSRSLDARDTASHERIPSPPSPAPSSTSPRRCRRAASNERSPRPSASGSTTTARSPTSSLAPTGTEGTEPWPGPPPKSSS